MKCKLSSLIRSDPQDFHGILEVTNPKFMEYYRKN